MIHPLLKRQLDRVGIQDESPSPDYTAWSQLLERISKSYTETEQHRYLLERSLEVSSSEMQAEIEERKKAEETLQNAKQQLEAKNRQLERVHEFLRSTLEQVTDAVHRGAPKNELLSYLEQVNNEFKELS